MPELAARLPCPVCLGVTMQHVQVGGARQLEVDLCQRCGGIWLERGEIQRLRAQSSSALRTHLENRTLPQATQCHGCHAPLHRDAGECAACGWTNLLDCPACDRRMKAVWHGTVRLDVCTHCQGTWFDHHELAALWGPQFDATIRRHQLTRNTNSIVAADMGDIALNVFFFSPDLMMVGGAMVGDAVSATGAVMAQLPEAVAATPEAATAVFEVITETATGVFEVVVLIVTALFD